MTRSSEPVRQDDLKLLGKIVATHGIRGQLKVASFSGEFDTLLSLESVVLKGKDGMMETFPVARATVHHNRVLISLTPFTNINEVLHLVGYELYAHRDQFPPLEEGEFYWCDLIGLQVVTENGAAIGRLDSILPTGSHDVYVVRGADREYLIPAVEDVVVQVDLAAGTMTVSPPEGLLDL